MGDTRFSKYLAKFLRHEAKSSGVNVSPEGYVNVTEVLGEARRRGLSYTEADVRRIVSNDNKGRFKIREFSGQTQIKATQGHSFQVSDSDMVPVTRTSDVRAVLHGTKMSNWSSIKAQGLSRRNRTHIHFAQGETGVQSGFPPYCDIAIEINLEKALRDGIQFFTSENGVVLSPGNSSGVIPAQYFKQAYKIATKELLPL